MKIIYILIFISSILSANISLSFLDDKTKSNVKDFYIYQYLGQNISSRNACTAVNMAKRLKGKLFRRAVKKCKSLNFSKISKCSSLNYKHFLSNKKSTRCLKRGFRVSKLKNVNKSILRKIAKKLRYKLPKKAKIVSILASNNVFSQLVESDTATFFEIFNSVGKKYRHKHLNHKIPSFVINRLARYKKFDRLIEIIIPSDAYSNLKKSLFNVKSSLLSSKTNFLLGLNLINHGYKSLSLKYFDIALKKAYYRFDKDKIRFWKYLVTHDKSYLKTMLKSFDINMYTLLARDYLHEKYPKIVTKIKCENSNRMDFFIRNPFSWVDLLPQIKKGNKKDLKQIKRYLTTCDTLPHKAFILERESHYKTPYFIRPYMQYMRGFSVEQKSLILSIARQESRFVPASMSYVWAMGMMQFMPFLADATANKMKIRNFSYDKMFHPKMAIRFAQDHLKHLKRGFKHTLFISYAYNGGPGFTRKMFKQGLFKKRNKYEPFMSMELVPYKESRKYAKKVLANYVIYLRSFGRNVKMKDMINEIDRVSAIMH